MVRHSERTATVMQATTVSPTEGFQRQGSQESLRKKCRLWYRRSLKGTRGDAQGNGENSAGTLPRGWRQPRQTRSNSLVDYADPQRTTHLLEKQDNETYGFEVQTYGLQSTRGGAPLEMCTFVCAVNEDSAAESAGLTAGDVILTINGVSIEGSSHQHVIDQIRESTNVLKMETVCGAIVKRIELDKKMSVLKQALREKWMELQELTSQEKRLVGDNLDDSSSYPSLESLTSLMSPAAGRLRFSSDGSYLSAVSAASSSDLASVFGDAASPSPAADANSFFFPGAASASSSSSSSSAAGGALVRCGSLASSGGSGSPLWEGGGPPASSLYGTLPRRGRRAVSIRRHICKFIPGFSHSLEEDEAVCANGH